MTDELACFMLGVNVAEHVHGINRKADDAETTIALFRTLREIAKGSLTLINTAAELTSDVPSSDQDLRIAIDASQRRVRAVERAMATEIMNSLPNELRKTVDDDDHGADEMVDDGDRNTD